MLPLPDYGQATTSPFDDNTPSASASSPSIFGLRSAGIINSEDSPSNRRTSNLSQLLSSTPASSNLSASTSQGGGVSQQHQHSTPERERERDRDRPAPLSFSALQRTFSQLHSKAQPTLDKLDRTRYKAEAGLTRRGFVPSNHSGLLQKEAGDEDENDVDGRRGPGDAYDDAGISADLDGDLDGWSEEDDGPGRRGRPRYSERGRARDDLKLPEGEGWTQL